MRRTKEQAEQTRIAILQAAEQLFLETGVARTSLEQIARQAGVTRGAVYWHFENKAHLFHEMLQQVRLPIEQIAQRLQADNQQTPLAKLRMLCIEAFQSLAHDPQRQRVFTILLHRCEFTLELRDAELRHQAFIQQFIALCEQLFAQPAVRERLRSGLNPHLAACALHAMLVGLFSDWLRDPELHDPLQSAAPILDAFFTGLLAPCLDA